MLNLGFNRVRLVSDCAAISMNEITFALEGEQNVLIVDFGSGYTSVMISQLEDTIFEALAVHGSEDCSGQRMDLMLSAELERTHNLNIPTNSPVKRRLMEACRRAKEQLSFEETSTIAFDLQDQHFTTSLTREKFLTVCKPVFEGFMNCVTQVLRQCKQKNQDIHRVVLAGGSSKIPYVTQLLKDFFERDIPIKYVEHGVIHGASFISSHPKNHLAIDVVSNAVGVETAGGVMHYLFPKGTCLVSKRMEEFSTYTDSSQGPSINIYEGGSYATKNNTFITRASISGVRSEVCLA